MAKIEYKEGELVGESLYLKEVASTDVKNKRRARFVCRCGNIFEARIDAVKENASCGCAHLDKVTTHGQSKNGREYRIWAGMKTRCTNSTAPEYSLYGGRGVKICERWENFVYFYQDMGRCPSPKHSLDRFPDKNGNYEPNNCRWATSTEQIRNRRNTIMVTYKEITKPLIEWCEDFGLRYRFTYRRIKAGRSAEDAFFSPCDESKIWNKRKTK